MRYGHTEHPNVRPRGLQRLRAASYMGVSPRTFDQLVKVERIPKIKVPGHRRDIYDVNDLDAVIDRWKKGHEPEAA